MLRKHLVLAIGWTLIAGCSASLFGQTKNSLEALAKLEVVELHRFIEDWSNARLDDTDQAYERFASALAPDFVLISPDGSVARRDGIVGGFRAAYGRWLASGEGGGRIEIREVELRALSPPLAVVSYQEWHFVGDQEQGRVSTVVLRQKEGAPGGVEWVHLHEVGIPSDP